MKKLFSLIPALILFVSAPCYASGVVFEQVVSVTSGTTTITSIPDSVLTGLVQVSRGGACRMTFGRVAVSSTNGIYLEAYAGGYSFLSRGEMVAAQFTTDTGNSGSGASLYVIGWDYK